MTFPCQSMTLPPHSICTSSQLPPILPTNNLTAFHVTWFSRHTPPAFVSVWQSLGFIVLQCHTSLGFCHSPCHQALLTSHTTRLRHNSSLAFLVSHHWVLSHFILLCITMIKDYPPPPPPPPLPCCSVTSLVTISRLCHTPFDRIMSLPEIPVYITAFCPDIKL